MEDIKRFLRLHDGKRVYNISTDEVSREEFQFCQTVAHILWGPEGFVQHLGPTWNMVYDPRFSICEDMWIRDYKAVFGGDARQGRVYISSEGDMNSSLGDLEQYAEMIGEGRYFCNVLLDKGESPDQFYLKPEEEIYALLKTECPNYFSANGEPNRLAQTMCKMMKADLLGMIADYAFVGYLDAWIKLENGEKIDESEFKTHNFTDSPVVHAEIDFLEQALSARAVLRANAVKIITQLHLPITSELTEMEVDELVRLIYLSGVDKDKLYTLTPQIMNICMHKVGYDLRQADQIERLKKESKQFVQELIEGTRKRNTLSYSTPKLGFEETLEEKQLKAIMESDVKKQLFILMVEAEQLGLTEVFNKIKPIIDNPESEVDQDFLNDLLQSTRGQRVAASVRQTLPGSYESES